MSKYNGLEFRFTMEKRHYDAMLLEHPGVFIPADLILLNTFLGSVSVNYAGWPEQINRMAKVVWDWQTKPPTEKQLRDILGGDANGQD